MFFLKVGFVGTCITLCSFGAQAELKRQYSEPTRGFFLEHGTVAGNGQASVELHSGVNQLDSGGGIRLGLPNAELIINSGLDDYDGNEVLLKWGMRDLNLNGRDGTPLKWTLIGAVSHADVENDQGVVVVDQTNVKLGAAITVNADAATFTLGGMIVHADGLQKEDTFVEVDLGAYVGVIETQAGLFSLGAEAMFTSADNDDDSFAFGGRWAYNERLNLDVVPFVFSDGDSVGIPGLVRLNVSF